MPQIKTRFYKRERIYIMRKGDIIILSDGQKATVIFGDESNYQYSCIVKLEDGQLMVVEEKNISLPSLN